MNFSEPNRYAVAWFSCQSSACTIFSWKWWNGFINQDLFDMMQSSIHKQTAILHWKSFQWSENLPPNKSIQNPRTYFAQKSSFEAQNDRCSIAMTKKKTKKTSRTVWNDLSANSAVKKRSDLLSLKMRDISLYSFFPWQCVCCSFFLGNYTIWFSRTRFWNILNHITVVIRFSIAF